MVYVFLSSIVLVLVCTSFHYLYCRNGIEEAYLGLFKGLIEEAVIVAGANGGYQTTPMIYLPRLNSLCNAYFNENLSPYCRNYNYSILCRDRICRADVAHAIRITITAKIDDIHVVKRNADFTIRRTDNDKQ